MEELAEEFQSAEMNDSRISDGVGRTRLYEAVLASTPDLAYIFGLDHRFLYANAALLDMWGKTWNEAIGKNCLELGYEPWHAEMHDREIDEVVATGMPVRGEVPFTGQSGRRIYDYIFTPIQAPGGKVIAVAGTTRDVTERKADEENAKFLSDLSKKLVLSASGKEAADVVVEMLGRYLDASRCVFGETRTSESRITLSNEWTREGVASIQGDHPLFEFGDSGWWEDYAKGHYSVDDVTSHPQTRDRTETYLAVGVKSYAAHTHVVDDDRVLILSVNSATPRHWTKWDLEVLAESLSRLWPHVERFRVETELKNQSQRLELLWKAAEILLKSENPETMLQRIFDTISGILELDVYINFLTKGDKLELSSHRGLEAHHVEDLRYLEFGQAICGLVALTRKPIVENRIERSEDPKCMAVKGMGLRAYVCNPLMAGDQLLGTLSFGSRTRPMFSEEETQFIETVTHYVTAAYVRLRLMEDLRDSDRKKDQFLATLAHELRNPISPILTGLEVIRTSSGQPERIEKVAGMISDQTKHIVHLIDDLLELSRISTGKIVLKSSVVEIGRIATEAAEVFRPAVSNKRQELVLSLPDHPVFLTCDPHRIFQVISNLLGNAVKYTPLGGKVQLSVKEARGAVEITVADSGIGISPEAQARVFELYEQEDNERRDGLGIGLTLVRTLVHLHGGEITLFSEGRDQGSTFKVALPAYSGRVSDNPNQGKPEEGRRDHDERRILVVDDEPGAADMLRMMLESNQMEVEVAYGGLAAVEQARGFRPDVVFLDLGMPGMDGFEAARLILKDDPEIALVALSGWGRQEDREKAATFGFIRHLVKPVSPQDVWDVLGQLHHGSCERGKPQQSPLR